MVLLPGCRLIRRLIPRNSHPQNGDQKVEHEYLHLASLGYAKFHKTTGHHPCQEVASGLIKRLVCYETPTQHNGDAALEVLEVP